MNYDINLKVDLDRILRIIQRFKRRNTLRLNYDKFNVINELGIIDLCGGDTLIMKKSHVDKLYWHENSFYTIEEMKVTKVKKGKFNLARSFSKFFLNKGVIIRKGDFSGILSITLKSKENKQIILELGEKITPLSKCEY